MWFSKGVAAAGSRTEPCFAVAPLCLRLADTPNPPVEDLPSTNPGRSPADVTHAWTGRLTARTLARDALLPCLREKEGAAGRLVRARSPTSRVARLPQPDPCRTCVLPRARRVETLTAVFSGECRRSGRRATVIVVVRASHDGKAVTPVASQGSPTVPVPETRCPWR